jgi:DNA ligase-1
MNGSTENKMKVYKNQHLEGTVILTRKLDGVQAIWGLDNQARSRNDKPLYNLPQLEEGIKAEIFLGSFKSSISAVKTHGGVLIDKEHIYTLFPVIDERLFITEIINPHPETIEMHFNDVLDNGDEGLVLHFKDGREPLKVKKKDDASVRVTDIIEGTGRNKGRLGALMTDKGKVGTGFTDHDREALYTPNIIGMYIDVSFMEITADGKMRHPRFIKIRPDIS